jgi:hypothetical protein
LEIDMHRDNRYRSRFSFSGSGTMPRMEPLPERR